MTDYPGVAVGPGYAMITGTTPVQVPKDWDLSGLVYQPSEASRSKMPMATLLHDPDGRPFFPSQVQFVYNTPDGEANRNAIISDAIRYALYVRHILIREGVPQERVQAWIIPNTPRFSVRDSVLSLEETNPVRCGIFAIFAVDTERYAMEEGTTTI